MNRAGPTQVIGVVEAQFMIRGQIIALCGMWALNGVWAHAVLYIRSQAVLSLELSTIPGLLIVTQSMSRIRIQSSAHLKTGFCVHAVTSPALHVLGAPLPSPATHIYTHTEPLAAFQTGCVLVLSGSLHL